jgi:hypothetical protein
MPVILNAECYDLWLDPGMTDAGAASEMLKPYHALLCGEQSDQSRRE